jgi:hypothetical protein
VAELIVVLEAIVSILKGCTKLQGLFAKKGKSKPSKDIETINTE